MTATDEERQVHRSVLVWSRALIDQVDRLRFDRAAAIESQRKMHSSGCYRDHHSWPFYTLEADKHFVMVAARQLLRALDAFDGNDRLPAAMSRSDVRLVRDALEHWDEPTGKANSKMAERGANPKAHTWRHGGEGLLADVVEDGVLRAWAVSVYDELKDWDPFAMGETSS